MRIRMKISVSGMFHGNPNGVNYGDVVDVDGMSGARYCALHYAEPVVVRDVETATMPAPEDVETRAGDEADSEKPKRAPGRPRSAQA